MFECEDTSIGFHDLFLNKYADSSGSVMDFFISDSMQDMLDIDIRTEVATVVGSVSEFTSLVNDLPSSIENESNHSNSPFEEPDRWYVGEAKWTSASEIFADVGACVNPNSVMPLINSTLLNSSRAQINLNTTQFQRSPSPLPSPKENKSHLTFSPNQIKIRSIDEVKRSGTNTQNILSIASQQQQKQQQQQSKHMIDTVKKDLIMDLKSDKPTITKILTAPPGTPVIPATIAGGNTIKLAPGLGGLTFANGMAYTKIKQSTIDGTKIIRTSNGSIVAQIKKETDTHHQQHHNLINGTVYTTTNGMGSPKMLARNVLPSNKITNVISNDTHQSTVNQTSNNAAIKSKQVKTIQHELPKPPYSYSCLIAMSLKNSRSGLLPVSEIYSFMCEHFPYFKTAPTGWKNSVRHNLSLNKCFEKIEKPATNGSQRKGCLWAMNPSKISKMDEEVQKWSRKDPMAIRQAMVHPEHLESLERGEMKHGSSGDSDGENDVQSDVEESSDLEGELDERIIETPESMEDEEEEKYDVEVSNAYDTIELGSSRSGGGTKNDSIQLAISNGEVYEITDVEPSFVAKKARLDINYSIAPASVFEQHHSIQHHQQSSSQTNHHQPQHQHHNRRKMQLVNRIV